MSTTSNPPMSAPTVFGPSDPGYSSSDPLSNDYQRYIYVLIAVFLGILFVSYWLLVRRRKRALAILRANGQLASGHDGMAVWAPIYRRQRREEGLDERGEAPPPYMPGQTPSHSPISGYNQAMPMHDLAGKPPDYMEHPPSDDEHDLMRPPPTHPPSDRTSAQRRQDGGPETIEDRAQPSSARSDVRPEGSTASPSAMGHVENSIVPPTEQRT